jgi:hypothetical protein
MEILLRPLILLFLATVAVYGGTPVIEKSFKEKYPDVEAPRWKSESDGGWEAQFSIKGIEYRADFDSEGNWLETEQDVSFSQLPNEVRSAIELKYDPNTIRDIEGVESPTHGFFFDVEFQVGAEKVDVMFDPTGKILDPAIPPTEKGFFKSWLNQTERETSLNKTGWTLITRALFNLLTIFIYAYLIYYRRHHDHKMLFLLFAFNLFLFPIFLSSSLVTAGFGFTIFALLALVRLRSEAFDKAEIAYLLGAISLTFVNTMMPITVDIPSALLILLTAFIVDRPSVWRDEFQKIEIDYRMNEKERMLDHSYLRKRISDDYLIDVSEITVNRVIKNEIRLTLTYRKLPSKQRADLVIEKEQEREQALLEKQRAEDLKQQALVDNS